MTDTLTPEPADAPAMLHDAETLDPLADAEVVETGVAFVEGPRLGELAMLGEGDQHVVPNQHGLGHAVDLYPPPLGEAQHLGVPAHAAVEVADAQGDVVNAVDAWSFSHGHQ